MMLGAVKYEVLRNLSSYRCDANIIHKLDFFRRWEVDNQDCRHYEKLNCFHLSDFLIGLGIGQTCWEELWVAWAAWEQHRANHTEQFRCNLDHFSFHVPAHFSFSLHAVPESSHHESSMIFRSKKSGTKSLFYTRTLQDVALMCKIKSFNRQFPRVYT